MKTISTTVKWLALLALLPLLVSCGDSGTPATSEAGKLSARFIGTMPADLADELDQEFSESSADSTAPLLISEVDLNTLSDAERSVIKTTFDNDVPVILVNPTRTQREALRSLVGLTGTDLSGDIPEFWGVQTSKKFEIWEYSETPAARQVIDTDVTIWQADGTSQMTNGAGIEDYLIDMPYYQLSRVAGLKEWLALAPERAGQVVNATTSKTVAATTATDETKATLEQVILADYAPVNFSYLTNEYGINLSSRSVYQAGNSYFVISAVGILSASPEWNATTTATERNHIGQMTPTDADLSNTGRIASKYNIRFRVPNALSNELSEASKVLPVSDVSTEEMTNTLGWSLGGKVTGGAECTKGTSVEDAVKGKSFECTAKVGFELSGGVQSTESRTFTKKDVAISNTSTPGAPSWSFDITPPKMVRNWLQFPYWHKPAILATSTFQPEMTWVWKVSDSFKQRYPGGLPILVEFTPTLHHSYNHYTGWITEVSIDLFPAKPFSNQITMPWPPTTSTVKK